MVRSRKQKAELQLRRVQVAGFYVRGMTQRQMAKELGVCQPSIHNDLKAIHDEWRESRIRDLDALIDKELASLEDVIQKASTEWESKKDPKFLQIMLKAFHQRCKLLHLYEHVPAEPEDTVDEPPLNPIDARVIFDTIMARLQERAAANGASTVDGRAIPDHRKPVQL